MNIRSDLRAEPRVSTGFVENGQPAEDFDLGRRLKQTRIAARLSQRQLANRADVSNTTISLIEQNRTSPSVALLKRILGALPISLSEFFVGGSTNVDRPFYHAVQLNEVSSGEITTRALPVENTANMAHSIYRPGADSGELALDEGTRVSGFVVSGYLEVTVNGERGTLGPGDAYSFDGQLAYRLRNINDVKCEVVAIRTAEVA
jgi:transcriptional regulator with XRE-family HTH domain